MKVTILKEFHDKDSFSLVYKIGQVVEFEKERADRLLQLGLAIETAEEKPVVEEPKEEPKAEPIEEVTETVEEPIAEEKVEEVAEVAEPIVEEPKEEVVLPKKFGKFAKK